MGGSFFCRPRVRAVDILGAYSTPVDQVQIDCIDAGFLRLMRDDRAALRR
jgi:hypothetical protein